MKKTDFKFTPVKTSECSGNWFFDFGKHYFAVLEIETEAAAAPAQALVHAGRTFVVLVHLARAASAAHAQILDRAAETRLFVPLEVV